MVETWNVRLRPAAHDYYHALRRSRRPIYLDLMPSLPSATTPLPPVAESRPFLRWAGSKRLLLPRLRPLLSSTRGRYIEPFMGSAALFFSVPAQRGILSDLNTELVETFLTVRSRAKVVAQHLAGFANNEDAYYKVRALEPTQLSKVERAARFIYLNRFCFNGLYRTNKKGQFNVPYGRPKNDNRPTVAQLSACARRLRDAHIRAGDFEEVLRSEVRRHDLVYLDPPFAVAKRRVFSEYCRSSFSTPDLDRLGSTLRMIHERGATFVLSYAYCAEPLKNIQSTYHRHQSCFPSHMSSP
jgi:DNA adenine methylase